MLILGINTATANTEIALVDNGRKIFSRSWKSNRDEAEKIFPALKEALKKNKHPLGKIFVVAGPGPFTALRIGVTVANTLAFTKRIPLISISTFDFLLAKIPQNYKDRTAVAIKAGGDFSALLFPGAKREKRISYREISALLKRHRKIKFLVGDVPEKTLPRLPGKFLKKFSDVIIEFSGKKNVEHKIAKPRYLLPPKITKSKKEIFTQRPALRG